MAITQQEIQQLMLGVGGVLKTELAARDERIAALTERLAAVEARPHLEYRGVWERETTYTHGNCVTKDGSVWICIVAPTTSEPGVDHVCWKLAVKRGKNGRDGKDAAR